MKTFWNFPAATGGLINSINNAGLETFRGNALDSLTREICQNSLDAVKDTSKPVVVEFTRFSTSMSHFPNKDELIEVFNKCEKTWKGRNPKSEEFIEAALNILKQPSMDFLRISDFNTKGLEGAESGELGTPWSSLVREAGSSNKGESSGGSFGIGKSAPFLNSNLRTLFYSSKDIKGYESHIGVANIMSFKKNESQITLGNGYYTYNNQSNAIPGLIQLDEQFNRNESGTDIYVAAFHPKAKWEQEILKSVLFNFFITVHNQKLVVRINDFEINHRNIEQLINELADNEENQILKNYFQLLISEKTIKVAYPTQSYKTGIHFEEGEATLYLFNGEDLNRRVLMTRKTGMKIFEQKNISGSISFTGLLMITGTNMNNIFKNMENPAHTEWAPERYEKNPKIAKTIYSDLRKFIRATVKDKFQEQITDEMDAVGLSDFLPNKNLVSGNSVNKTESLNTKIKSIVTKEVKREKTNPLKRKGKETEEFEEQLVGEFGITTTGDKGGNLGETKGNSGDNGGGANHPDEGNEVDPSESGNKEAKKKKSPSKKPVHVQQRSVSLDKSIGFYRIFVTPEKTLESGRLVFRVLGEQSDYDLPIKNATTDDSNIMVEGFNSNAVYVNSIRKNKTFMINVSVDYYDYCVLEVELYEN